MATARAAVRARHAVLSLTTSFRLPHEGMTEMEYLSRGSAFLLDTAGRSAAPLRGRDLAILTCQHVACPWLFPKYFADKWSWLQHVSEEFVEHSLQLLELPPASVCAHDPTSLFVPKVLMELPLERRVWLHPSRDVAMLSLAESLADEAWTAYADSAWGLELLSLQAREDERSQRGDVVLFTGHTQFSDTISDAAAVEAAAAVGQCPKQVIGNFVAQSSEGQAFAWSEEVLTEGMCGGAVVNTDGACIGLIEGIVPPFVDAGAAADGSHSGDAEDPATAMRKALANHVAFIPATELASFVHDRGSALATGTLLGVDDSDDDDDALCDRSSVSVLVRIRRWFINSYVATFATREVSPQSADSTHLTMSRS